MRRIFLAAVFLGLAAPVFAGDITNLPALNQNQFNDLSTDLSAVLTMKQFEPAAPEGLLGFNIGVDATVTNVAHQADWNTATNSTDVTSVPMARVRVTKGLPFGFDIGGYYSSAPGTNIKVWGGELRYAIVEGGTLTPAVGLRATYNRLSGVSQLGFNSRSLDLSVSKGFGPFTPYAGIGRVWANSNPEASTGLQNYSFSSNETYVGFNLSMVVATLTLEANRIAGNNTYGVKLGFGF